MVLGDLGYHLVQSHDPSCCQKPSLPYASPKSLLVIVGLLNEIPRAKQQRTIRATQALAYAKTYGVGVLGQLTDFDSKSNSSVEYPRPIGVYLDSVFLCQLFYLLETLQRPHSPVSQGILNADQSSLWIHYSFAFSDEMSH